MKLMLVVGARPQFIKSAPIIREVQKHEEIELQLIHTGQHYDFEMSKIFFQEMELPKPMVNLGVGSGTHAWQTGNMMIKLEKTMIKGKPDLVMVPGDTNSTLAGALAAVKLNLSAAHIEAGARSYDMRMPEEINRRLTDHCSSLLFAPTSNCVRNLQREDIPKQRIRLVGDPMYDALLQHLLAAAESKILEKLSLEGNEYAALTLHRPENVDVPEALTSIMEAITKLKEFTVVFPVHPRTREQLIRIRLLAKIKATHHVKLVDPVGYQDMLQLIKHAKLVFTDSGGLQKEAFWLNTPCVTLRDKTEWIETMRGGANVLVGSNSKRIVAAARRICARGDIKSRLQKLKNPFGDGQASETIVAEALRWG